MAILIFFVWYYQALPSALFRDPTSTVLEDRTGRLLSARIAEDGQWRFPEVDSIPEKFKKCILTFEDKSFYQHIGVNPLSIGRAIKQNLSAGKIVSGASTITMQTIRLMRKNKNRTFREKILEMVLATRLELKLNKEDILKLYASHAPFGGNVVGIEAASWRYFGNSAENLSWSESAMLAVLPNAPALIHPGRNRKHLLNKRNRLLDKLREEGIISKEEASLGKLEPLPKKPLPLPDIGLHALNYASSIKGKGKRYRSTIDYQVQRQMKELAFRHAELLKQNEIHNLAILIADVDDASCIAYVGNIGKKKKHGFRNDMVQAERSSGSILKPLLYGGMIHHGKLMPEEIVADIPTQYGRFAPENYNHDFQGAIGANLALAQSLNVPTVRSLKQYGIPQFMHDLEKMGVTTLKFDATHYGLSVVLGGAEVKLWDLVNVYGGLAKQLKDYPTEQNSFDLKILNDHREVKIPYLDVGSIWHMFEAMKLVKRPESEGNWKEFANVKDVAWKTGTSFGNRDAWSIGITREYVIGIWVGNADGEGRAGLTGISTAAPILFDVLNTIGYDKWFIEPSDGLVQMKACKQSGMKSSEYCDLVDYAFVSQSLQNSQTCKFCKRIYLDKTKEYRVDGMCEAVSNMRKDNWFVLPKVMEWYYKKKHPNYKELPPFRADCLQNRNDKPMRLIYPRWRTDLYLPIDFDQSSVGVVFEASHRDRLAKVHWHFDGKYLGETQEHHEMEIFPEVGDHWLMLIDENGFTHKQQIRIKTKKGTN